MARFSLPRTVAVQAMRPPAIVARTRLVPLSLMSAAGMTDEELRGCNATAYAAKFG